MTAQPQDHLKSAKDLPKTVEIDTSAGPLALPHPAHMPAGIIRKVRKIDDQVEQFYFLVEAMLGEDSAEIEILDKLPMWEMGDVFKQWSEGAQLGESSSSSN